MVRTNDKEVTVKTTIRRTAIVALSFAVIFTIAGQRAFAQDVRYNFDRDADFSKYKTYKWVDNKNAQRLEDLAERQFKTAMDAELAKKGLSRVDSNNADLYLSYQVALQQEKQYTSFDSGWGYGRGWRSWGGAGMSTGQTSTIHVGAVDVDMYDVAERQLVWEGTASKTIDPKAKPDKQQKNLEKAVAKLLKNYPPEKK
jgi:hypothetical protein